MRRRPDICWLEEHPKPVAALAAWDGQWWLAVSYGYRSLPNYSLLMVWL